MGKNKTAPSDLDSPRRLNHSQHPAADVTDNNGDYGEKFHFDPDFEGPVRNRSCTDVICLGLFLALLGGWGFVAYIGFSEGDINKVGSLSVTKPQGSITVRLTSCLTGLVSIKQVFLLLIQHTQTS